MAPWRASLVAALCIFGPAAAAPRCGLRASELAGVRIEHARDWPALHAASKRLRTCDDGAPADAATERVLRLLVDRWSELPSLDAEAKADPVFRVFVLSHIDSTADSADLEIVQRLARDRCPSASRRLCRGIAEAAARALRQ